MAGLKKSKAHPKAEQPDAIIEAAEPDRIDKLEHELAELAKELCAGLASLREELAKHPLPRVPRADLP